MQSQIENKRKSWHIVVEKDFLLYSKASVHARFLYLLIESHSSKSGRTAFPGRELLAEAMGVSLATLKRYLTELKDLGWVTSEQRKLSHGHFTSNVYTVFDPVFEEGVDGHRGSQASHGRRLTGKPRTAAHTRATDGGSQASHITVPSTDNRMGGSRASHSSTPSQKSKSHRAAKREEGSSFDLVVNDLPQDQSVYDCWFRICDVDPKEVTANRESAAHYLYLRWNEAYEAVIGKTYAAKKEDLLALKDYVGRLTWDVHLDSIIALAITCWTTDTIKKGNFIVNLLSVKHSRTMKSFFTHLDKIELENSWQHNDFNNHQEVLLEAGMRYRS